MTSPCYNLLVHVEEEFSATVLSDNGSVASREWVHKVPVPVVQIDANILAEVSQAMLLIQVRGGVVPWDDDRGALKIETSDL